MLGEAFKLSLVLLLCLAVWIGVERSTWPQNYYSQFEAQVHNIPTYNASHESHFNPKYFSKASIISNDTHMVCPEDIGVSSKGDIYTGLIDGSVIKVREGSNETTLLYKHNDTGRIYGLIITRDDLTLYYATEKRGLVKLDLKSNTPEYLLEEVDGKIMKALNNLAIDEDSQILYLTDSGPIPMPLVGKQIMLAHKAGRIIQFHLRNRTAKVIIDKVAFPNGIVFEAKSNSIIYSQLSTHQIWKYQISSGKKTLLIDNIFGFADNLKLSYDTGDLLIGLVSARDPLTEFIKDKPALRKILMFLPERMVWALATKTARAIRVDTTTGAVLEYMYGAPTKIKFVTTVVERNEKLYLSSLRTPTIIILDKNRNGFNKTLEVGPERREEL